MTTSEATSDSPLDENQLPGDQLPSGQLPSGQLAGDSATSNPSHFPKIIKFDALARCGEEIWIENNGQIYRLRRTRQGKLILTK